MMVIDSQFLTNYSLNLTNGLFNITFAQAYFRYMKNNNKYRFTFCMGTTMHTPKTIYGG